MEGVTRNDGQERGAAKAAITCYACNLFLAVTRETSLIARLRGRLIQTRRSKTLVDAVP